MQRTPMPDVVVVVPGILGSVLEHHGREVWGRSLAAGFRALISLGQSIADLTLHVNTTDPESEPDGVHAASVLPDLHLIPYLWKIDGYSRLTQSLQTHFELRAGSNYFEFPYDWRRDNRLAARRLRGLADGWLRKWRDSSGNGQAKLIIVAHSMGSLVARYFLEVLEGWRDTKGLITFGTPHRGSLNALRTLVEGLQIGPDGVLELSTMVRSLTSVYQLLPTYPCITTPGGELVHVSKCADLPHVLSSKLRDAVAFHDEIRAAVERHLREDAYHEQRYRVISVVGTHQETLQSAQIEPRGGLTYLHSHADRNLKGDGRVPRVSATPLEHSHSGTEVYVATCHASLQNSPEVLHHMFEVMVGFDLNLAAPIYRADTMGFRVSLDLQDGYFNDEPVTFRVATDPVPSPPLVATITSIRDGSVTAQAAFPAGHDDWMLAEIPPLPAGSYRCAVKSDALVQPATDVFAVFERRPTHGG